MRSWLAPSGFGRGAIALALLFLLALIAYGNYHTYFDKQQSSNVWEADSDISFVAKEMHRLGPRYRYIISGHYARPTLSFINPRANGQAEYNVDLIYDLPLTESRPTAIFLNGARRREFHWLRALYPGATIRQKGPAGADQVIEVLVAPREIDALRGTEATYTSRSGAVLSRRESAVDADWTAAQPVALPFDARWSGLLRFSKEDTHAFDVSAPASMRFWIDGQLLASGTRELTVVQPLSRGYHRFEIEAAVDGPGRVSFRDNGQPLPHGVYYSTVSGRQGLLASFFDTDDWSGEPKLQRIDPFVGFFYASDIPFFGISSATWTGSLEVPTTGSYSIDIEATGFAAVTLDGADVLSTSGRTGQRLDLSAGRHLISVRYRYTGGALPVLLYWTPPGQDRELIPARYLAPP